jgi:hypothetical protein
LKSLKEIIIQDKKKKTDLLILNELGLDFKATAEDSRF